MKGQKSIIEPNRKRNQGREILNRQPRSSVVVKREEKHTRNIPDVG